MSVEITDEMAETAARRYYENLGWDWNEIDSAAKDHSESKAVIVREFRATLDAAAPAIQEAVAYRIASKLNALSTERAQADDMNASRDFKQAADVAIRVAKGGW